MPDDDPFGTRAPYWRRHYGIGHLWSPRPSGRRGCLLMLYGALVVIVLALLIAAVTALLR